METLEHHMEWLYGEHGVYPGNQRCLCEHAYQGLGVLYGVSMGKGWVRTTTDAACPHHGIEASRWRSAAHRRKR